MARRSPDPGFQGHPRVPGDLAAVSDTRTVTGFLNTALHDGSPWFVLACVAVFAGVVMGLYARSGIISHPYESAGDMPHEANGREELATILWPRRAGRRVRRDRT
jgi:hypothetical protein